MDQQVQQRETTFRVHMESGLFVDVTTVNPRHARLMAIETMKKVTTTESNLRVKKVKVLRSAKDTKEVALRCAQQQRLH